MIDLHTHSSASDGSLHPEALLRLAAASGLSHLALTDHNTTQGLPEFLRAARGTGVHPIAGVEISSTLETVELHLLAMDLPQASFSQAEEFLSTLRRRAEESKMDLVENLRRAGYNICFEDIQRRFPDSVINRSHIAMALVEGGYVSSVQEAFGHLLRKSTGFYHPPEHPPARQVIQTILDLGAIPVWAHPFFRQTTEKVRWALEQLAPWGLVGMEIYYSTYTPEQTADALALARAYGLKESGGSDFHGSSKPDISLGTGRGNLNIPPAVAERLLDRGRK